MSMKLTGASAPDNHRMKKRLVPVFKPFFSQVAYILTLRIHDIADRAFFQSDEVIGYCIQFLQHVGFGIVNHKRHPVIGNILKHAVLAEIAEIDHVLI